MMTYFITAKIDYQIYICRSFSKSDIGSIDTNC